jgi:hypothetical protein
MILLRFINTLTICSIAYLVIGVILFCYLLIDQLRAFHTAVEARPILYYEYKIDSVIIILNVITGIVRITGSITILFFITILKIEIKRSKKKNKLP